MVKFTTTFEVDINLLDHWLELNGGELVGCDRNSRTGEFMYIVRLGSLGLEAIAERMRIFRTWIELLNSNPRKDNIKCECR